MVDGEVRVSAADKLAELAEEVREMTAKLRERDRELPLPQSVDPSSSSSG